VSGGWTPCANDWWPVVAESLTQPWPREAACMDLRWSVDQRGDVPSRRQLAKRWGWTPGKVRGLLRSPDEWWDPKKGEAPRLASPRPADKPKTGPTLHPPGPDRTQADPPCTQPDPEVAQTGEEEGEQSDTSDPPCAQADPAGPDRTHLAPDRTQPEPHASYQPSPSPSQQPVCVGQADQVRVLELWAAHAVAAGQVAEDVPHGSPLAQLVASAITEHGVDDIDRVVRWFWVGVDKRATWLRDRDFDLRTLLDPEKIGGNIRRARGDVGVVERSGRKLTAEPGQAEAEAEAAGLNELMQQQACQLLDAESVHMPTGLYKRVKALAAEGGREGWDENRIDQLRQLEDEYKAERARQLETEERKRRRKSDAKRAEKLAKATTELDSLEASYRNHVAGKERSPPPNATTSTAFLWRRTAENFRAALEQARAEMARGGVPDLSEAKASNRAISRLLAEPRLRGRA